MIRHGAGAARGWGADARWFGTASRFAWLAVFVLALCGCGDDAPSGGPATGAEVGADAATETASGDADGDTAVADANAGPDTATVDSGDGSAGGTDATTDAGTDDSPARPWTSARPANAPGRAS